MGSSPFLPGLFCNKAYSLIWLEHTAHNSKNVGSSPTKLNT